MSRQRVSDLEKGSQEEAHPYRQNHEDPATPTSVTTRGWFTSLLRRLGFNVENSKLLTPLLTTPVAVQYGSLSESSAPERWPDLSDLADWGGVDPAWPPRFVDDHTPFVNHSIHTFFCNPQYHSAKGQARSTMTVHLGLYWYQTTGYVEIPPIWRGHLADFATSDEISVTLDPLCPTRKVYTRTISIDYQRGPSESCQGPPEFLVLRPRDSKSRAEARVEVSVSCRSREWLSNEPPDNFSNLIY
ncbi:hypothetical protein QBC40DRAFT_296222 [Triangularia verruculosa]|uniref:Uncharacterized protein n=1 Tax=Triangularia verruculosa TaxID=2587418 RepID=A0AAN7AVP8_9PEZI|nr:hypothetical protein QBC40DRAFT_296222 [Triangularia verruculosa]